MPFERRGSQIIESLSVRFSITSRQRKGLLLSHSGDSRQRLAIAPNCPIRSRPRRPARKSVIQAESPKRPTGPQSMSCSIRASRKAPMPGPPAHTFHESSSDGTGEPKRFSVARRQSHGLIHTSFTALASSHFRSITVQLRPLTHPRAFRIGTSQRPSIARPTVVFFRAKVGYSNISSRWHLRPDQTVDPNLLRVGSTRLHHYPLRRNTMLCIHHHLERKPLQLAFWCSSLSRGDLDRKALYFFHRRA